MEAAGAAAISVLTEPQFFKAQYRKPEGSQECC